MVGVTVRLPGQYKAVNGLSFHNRWQPNEFAEVSPSVSLSSAALARSPARCAGQTARLIR